MWEELEQLEGRIPDDNHLCRKCGECCTRWAQVKKREAERIGQYLCANFTEEFLHMQFAASPDKCPFLKNNECIIYPVRPMACRLFGHAPWMNMKCLSGVPFQVIPMTNEHMEPFRKWAEMGEQQFCYTEDFRYATCRREDQTILEGLMPKPAFLEKIGSKRFPLNAGKKRVFGPSSGRRIEDEDLAALVRQIHKGRPFMCGSCYTNTEWLVMGARTNGFKVIPYVGWVVFAVPSEPEPVHHCWGLYGSNQVIDMSTTFESSEIYERFVPDMKKREEEIRKGHDLKEIATFPIAWRIAFARTMMPLERGDVIKNRIWGQMPPRTYYVGCPCDPEEGRRIYNRWHARYGKSSDRPGAMSPSQEIAMLIQEGKSDEDIVKHFWRTTVP